MTDAFPIEFLITFIVWAALCFEALSRLDQPWARPAVAVYMTIGAWYILDFTYNDWSPAAKPFSPEVIAWAFLQIAWFLITYRLILGSMVGWTEAPRQPATATSPAAQWQLFQGLAIAQLFFAAIGLIRTGGNPWNLLYPPAADPPIFLWGRGGVGQGLDFLVSAAGYTHIAVIAMLGVLIATADNPRLRWFAAGVFILALPPYLFQRRNLMLATLFPGILAYILVGRANRVTKVCFSAGMLLLINLWFLIVITTRDQGGTVGTGGLADSLEKAKASESKHHGLDMLTELCYINTFIDDGSYNPNYGERYFADVVTIVPRSIWPAKPYIGIDYAIARGFADHRADHGVNTTVATGMIGQGVVNFGRVFGPAASATLMALWTVILARAWNRRGEMPKLFLFMLGLGLTFNMGRDITLLVLFPYLFAAIVVYWPDIFGSRKHAVTC